MPDKQYLSDLDKTVTACIKHTTEVLAKLKDDADRQAGRDRIDRCVLFLLAKGLTQSQIASRMAQVEGHDTIFTVGQVAYVVSSTRADLIELTGSAE